MSGEETEILDQAVGNRPPGDELSKDPSLSLPAPQHLFYSV